MSVTFYYAPQSNATRVHWSLEELGIPYEKVKLDLPAGDTRKPEFLALNPNGKVPTITIDGTSMFESIAIQIALGERFGVEKGLWPAVGSGDHLQALAWLVWGQVTLGSALMRYMQNTHSYIPAEQHNAKAAAAGMEATQGCLAILDDRLKGRQYVLGERLTLVDVDIASVVAWGTMVAKLDMSKHANVAAWFGRMTARPAMKTVMAP